MTERIRRFTFLLLLCASEAARSAPDDTPPLKDLFLDTTLVAAGASQCRIATPADPALQVEARRVQEAIRRMCGVEPAIVDASLVTEADARAWHHVVLGHFANNAVIAKLYAGHLCFTDAMYPGPGGYEVRTLHNPIGWGRNCLLLGGSDTVGVRAAVDAFLRQLESPGTLSANAGNVVLHQIQVVTAPTLRFPVLDESGVTYRIKANAEGLDSGNVRAQMNSRNGILDAGLRHYLAGQESWGRVFRAALLHYYELAAPTGDWALLALSNDPGGQYFWPWKLAIIWDNIEESPVFNDDDRRKITRLLLNLTRWVASCDHFDLNQLRGATYGAPGDLRQGHSSYAALSMFFCDEYFRRYYPSVTEFAPRRADVARIFAGQAGSYKSNDNASIYSTLAPAHTLAYRLSRGDFDARDAQNLRALADYVIITTDNRADASTYGDGASYFIGYPAALGFLARAAWRFGDAGDRWAFDWIADRSERGLAARSGDLWCEGFYATGGPRSVPARLCGIAPLMVDEGLYDFMIRSKRNRPGDRPPRELCFDKLSFRQNFSTRDEYLLLSGLSGVLVHAHDDGNSVLRLTWRDRIWLANLGYRADAANEHNSLMVRRADRYESPPAFVALEARAELPTAGFTRTTVRGYNGVDWRRNILWRKGESFIFLDEVEARVPGEAQLQLVWRLLGRATLDDGDLRVEQAGEFFNVKSADDSRKILGHKNPDRNTDWSLYPHADGAVTVLSDFSELREDGHRVFLNVLFPGDATAIAFERLGERSLRIAGADGPRAIIGLATPHSELAGVGIEAAAYQITSDTCTVFAARRVTFAGLELESEAPISLELGWTRANGTVNAAQETRIVVNAKRVFVDGRLVAAAEEREKLKFTLPAGTHALRLDGLRLAPLDEWLTRFPALPKDAPANATAVPTLATEWRLNAGAPVRTLAIGDLDGDGSPEVVATAGNRVCALDARGTQVWNYRAAAPVACLELADLDGRGKLDVAFGAGITLYRLDGRGTEKWRRDCTHFKSALSTLTTADLKGDGRCVLLAGNENSALFAVDYAGTPLWHSYKDIGRAGITALCAGDFNGDGRAEIFVGTGRDHGAIVLDDRGERVLWKVPGTHHVARMTAHTIVVGGPQRRGPMRIIDPATGRTRYLIRIDDDVVDLAVTDVLGEGTPQIVVAFATSGVRVFDEAGRERQRVKVDSFASRLSVGDFCGTGRPQIAVGAQDGRVFVFDPRGALLGAARLPGAITCLAALPRASGASLIAGSSDGVIARFESKP